ncbi:MAG: FG-GAP repeat protein [Deltaproteobacteria bacterium]|nr:FG-GAP repeat protein [Deltaproteobacteria bacterium]
MSKITPSDAAASDFFGHVVAVAGDTVVVGARPREIAGGGQFEVDCARDIETRHMTGSSCVRAPGPSMNAVSRRHGSPWTTHISTTNRKR